MLSPQSVLQPQYTDKPQNICEEVITMHSKKLFMFLMQASGFPHTQMLVITAMAVT